jgi:hypothetical protein
MPSAFEAMLQDYLEHHWKSNALGFLFPAPRKIGFPLSRDNVVRCGFKPALRRLGVPDKDTGLHAYTVWQPNWLKHPCLRPPKNRRDMLI